MDFLLDEMKIAGAQLVVKHPIRECALLLIFCLVLQKVQECSWMYARWSVRAYKS